MKKVATFEEFISESMNTVLLEGFKLPIEEIHFETDPAKFEKLKLDFGKKLGGITNKEKIENADYELKRFRKSINYGDGNNFEPFEIDSKEAKSSKLGNGPHTRKTKTKSWNKKEYKNWLDSVSLNGGVENAYEMAQNAKYEPGLIDWIRKNNPGEDPLLVIQWDIEAYS